MKKKWYKTWWGILIILFIGYNFLQGLFGTQEVSEKEETTQQKELVSEQEEIVQVEEKTEVGNVAEVETVVQVEEEIFNGFENYQPYKDIFTQGLDDTNELIHIIRMVKEMEYEVEITDEFLNEMLQKLEDGSYMKGTKEELALLYAKAKYVEKDAESKNNNILSEFARNYSVNIEQPYYGRTDQQEWIKENEMQMYELIDKAIKNSENRFE